MSKDNTLKGVRSQHWYRLVSVYLEQQGIEDWEVMPPRRTGHPKLVVHHNGKTFVTPVPSTERGSGDHKYLVNRVRKFVEAA